MGMPVLSLASGMLTPCRSPKNEAENCLSRRLAEPDQQSHCLAGRWDYNNLRSLPPGSCGPLQVRSVKEGCSPMQLSIRDVARMLKVAEGVVYGWVRTG